MIGMTKMAFHPNAYLSETRNVRQGLTSRTRILRILERKITTAKFLAGESTLSYYVVLHHLRLMESEKIVLRTKSKKPYFWKLTGLGQQRLKPI